MRERAGKVEENRMARKYTKHRIKMRTLREIVIHELEMEKRKLLNTCQICRLVHGIRDIGISYCRTEGSNQDWGNTHRTSIGSYPNCQRCLDVWDYSYHRVWKALKSLEDQGRVQSIKGMFTDPIKKMKGWKSKDTMRIWQLNENWPPLIKYP